MKSKVRTRSEFELPVGRGLLNAAYFRPDSINTEDIKNETSEIIKECQSARGSQKS